MVVTVVIIMVVVVVIPLVGPIVIFGGVVVCFVVADYNKRASLK